MACSGATATVGEAHSTHAFFFWRGGGACSALVDLTQATDARYAHGGIGRATAPATSAHRLGRACRPTNVLSFRRHFAPYKTVARSKCRLRFAPTVSTPSTVLSRAGERARVTPCACVHQPKSVSKSDARCVAPPAARTSGHDLAARVEAERVPDGGRDARQERGPDQRHCRRAVVAPWVCQMGMFQAAQRPPGGGNAPAKKKPRRRCACARGVVGYGARFMWPAMPASTGMSRRTAWPSWALPRLDEAVLPSADVYKEGRQSHTFRFTWTGSCPAC